MRRSLRLDLLIAAGLFMLPLAFFWQVTLGSRTLLPADNIYQYQPWAAYRDQLGVPAVPHNALLSDLVLENLPWKQFIRQSFAQGELPLWNPYIFAGVPFLAAGQHSALYPFSIIYYVMPLEKAYGWFTVSQLWLAGLFMYLFMRGLGVGRLGSMLAAVAYQMSGFFIASVVFQMIIAAAAWLPFLLLMVEFTIRQRPAFGRPTVIPWVALGALGLGAEILAGHVEFTYYALLIMGFWAACRLGYLLIKPHSLTPSPQADKGNTTPVSQGGGDVGAGLKPAPTNRIRPLIKPAFSLIALVVLGLGVGAIQFIPLFELASYNFREGSASFQQVQSYAYPPRHALAFLMPNFYGSPAEHDYFDLFTGQQTPINWQRADGATVTDTYWEVNKNYVEGACYVGLLTLALAAIALLNARFEQAPHAQITTLAPYRGMFALLAVISVSFIFGTVAYAILYYGLPGINQLHSPFRWVFPLTLCLAALAGFGAEALQRARKPLTPNPSPSPSGERGLTPLLPLREKGAGVEGASFTFRLARIMGWTLVWIGGAVLAALIASRIFFAQLRGPIDSLFNKLAGANAAFPNVEAFYSYEFRQILLFALFLIACGVVIRVSRCPIYVRVPGWLKPSPPTPLPQGEGSTSGATPPLYEVERWAGGEANRWPIWEGLALVVLALDLVVASAGFNPAADPAWLHFEPPAITWLKQHNPQEWRFTAVEGATKTMNANLGWLYGLQDVAGYDSMIPKQYAEYMSGIQPQDHLIYNRIIRPFPDRLSALDSQWLDLLSVKYVISDIEINTAEHPKYKQVYHDQAVRIYENTDAVPRAYIVRASSLINFDHLNYEYSEGASARISEIAFNQVVVDVALPAGTSQPALILSDSQFPGWRAYIRPQGSPTDQEKEILVRTVWGNFREIDFDYPGAWTIRFRYSPPSFQVGAFTTFIALVILLFATLIWLWRRFYTEDASESGNARRFAKNSLAPIVLNLFNRGIDFAFAAIMLRILGPADAGTYYY
ncbi:MAG: hypothetical protein IT324_23230, partial [Anaerolineae bacterium]|nr:hypothetical protein [Anaerolineae bacterium]